MLETSPTADTWQFTVFVAGLSPEANEDSIKEYFSAFGEVKKVKLIADWLTNTTKDCALVSLETKEGFDAVLKKTEHEIKGIFVKVKPADKLKKGPEVAETSALLIKNITPLVSHSDVLNYFKKFGNINSSKFSKLKLPGSKSKSAVLRFENASTITKILEIGTNHEIDGVTVTCCIINNTDYLPGGDKPPTLTSASDVKLNKVGLPQITSAKLNQSETPHTRDSVSRDEISAMYTPVLTSSSQRPFHHGMPEMQFRTPQQFRHATNSNGAALGKQSLLKKAAGLDSLQSLAESFVLAVEYEKDDLFNIFCKQGSFQSSKGSTITGSHIKKTHAYDRTEDYRRAM